MYFRNFANLGGFEAENRFANILIKAVAKAVDFLIF